MQQNKVIYSGRGKEDWVKNEIIGKEERKRNENGRRNEKYSEKIQRIEKERETRKLDEQGEERIQQVE